MVHNCNEAVRDAMPALFDLLKEEPEASVRAVLGHFIFEFIHPYMDDNGRMGRFLMNVMLPSGGYPWTVIPVEQRETYMSALEEANVNGPRTFTALSALNSISFSFDLTYCSWALIREADNLSNFSWLDKL